MNMTVIYIVFGIIFGLIVLASIGMGAGQIVVGKKRKQVAARKEEETEGPALEFESENLILSVRDARVTVTTANAAPQLETRAEEPTKEEPAETPEGTFLPRAEKLSFDEKMAQLSPETLMLLGAFGDYMLANPECEKLQQANAIAYRYHKAQIVKVLIRRENVILNFAIVNPDLGRMVREDKSGGLKLKPVEIRLADEDALEVAKQTADLTLDYLKQEEEYRAEKRKEARREAARKKREELAAE